MAAIGIIGGSSVYALEKLEEVEEHQIDTPFGAPSDVIISGRMGGTALAFLPRHGRGHRLNPSEVPYRANIWALKKLGVEWLVSISAVGSMREDVPPGSMLLPDQYIDRTSGGRSRTFYDRGIVGHVGLADPACGILRDTVATAIKEVGVACRVGGTYVCIEGPAFSTKAESELYRSWGVDIIGMTAMPEVRLAREAEMHYTTVALVTDYDCWHATEETVNVESVLKILSQNAGNIKRVISTFADAVGGLQKEKAHPCGCAEAMRYGIITRPDAIGEEARARVDLLLGKYL